MDRIKIYYEVYDDMEKICRYFVDKDKFIVKVMLHPHHIALMRKERLEKIHKIGDNNVFTDKRDTIDKIS